MRELVVHMLPHRHARLNTAIYGEEYGFGVRQLDLILESEEYYYKILVPLTAQYNRFSDPILVCNTLTRDEWDTLGKFVEEVGIFKIVLSSANKRYWFLARVTIKGTLGEAGIGAMQMDLLWKEPTLDALNNRDVKLCWAEIMV